MPADRQLLHRAAPAPGFDMEILPMATRLARSMAYLGLACGVLYSVGGLVMDALTIGLHRGTALAFMAIVGMPLIFGTVGFIVGGLVALGARVPGALLDRMKT